MAFNVTPRIALPLSALMIAFALSLLLLPLTEMNLTKDPLFTTWRNQDGEFFAARRLEQAFVHYYLLHAVPAIVWSILMPLQYWDTLRKSRPALHRLTGYIAMSASLCLTISGLAFIPRQLAYSKPILTMHSVYGVPLIPSFNFALVFVVAPMMLFTGFRAVYLARNKRFAEHRRLAVYHGIIGYAISLQRVWMVLFNIFGIILDKAPSMQRFLHTDQIRSMKSTSDAEMAAFAFTTCAAGFTSVVWMLYVRQQNVSPSTTRKIK